MNLELVKRIADAVLYEGYILYPYRASAVKNQQRFNFGVLVPHSYSEGNRGSEAHTMRTQCLLEGDEPVIDVRVRFLQLASREVFQLSICHSDDVEENTAQNQLVPALEVGSKVYHTWQETIEREVVAENLSVRDLVRGPRPVEFAFERSETSETLYDADERAVGTLVRRQHSVQGLVTIGVNAQRRGLNRISVEIANTTPVETGFATRDKALVHSLASTHTLLGVQGGQFVSLLDPPEPLAEVAAACRNVGTWPVLVGHEGQRDMVLSSPIILYDYPQIAPESGGDFFDSTEVDEMLALRVMTLTDDEKREMQHVDPRARQILERTESLPPEQWQKLHGAIRGLKTIKSH